MDTAGPTFQIIVAQEKLDKLKFIGDETGLRETISNPETYMRTDNQEDAQELLDLLISGMSVQNGHATILYKHPMPAIEQPMEFTRTPTSVFGGSNLATNCWGNHIPSPPFFYYVDDCYVNSFDDSGPSSVHIRLKGEYEWRIIPFVGGAFDHQTTAKAEGTVTHDRAVCTVTNLPIGSSLECELDSGEPG